VLTLTPLGRYATVRELTMRSLALFPDNYLLLEYQAIARFELDHDAPAFFRLEDSIASVPDKVTAAINPL